MAKTPYVEDRDLKKMLKIAAVSGELPVRNVPMLRTLYGTGMTLQEIARLPIRAYLGVNGDVLDESYVSEEVAYNGMRRPVFWANKELIAALDDYLAYRIENRQMVTTRKGAYRGLDPDSPVFLTDEGEPYKLTKRKTTAGTISYSCDSLSQLFRKLHMQAGVNGASAASARRTFAVRLHNKGYDLKSIKVLLGLKTLRSTKNLIDADPVRLGAIAAGVF